MDLDSKTYFKYRIHKDLDNEWYKGVSNTFKATFSSKRGEQASEHSVFLAALVKDSKA